MGGVSSSSAPKPGSPAQPSSSFIFSPATRLTRVLTKRSTTGSPRLPPSTTASGKASNTGTTTENEPPSSSNSRKTKTSKHKQQEQKQEQEQQQEQRDLNTNQRQSTNNLEDIKAKNKAWMKQQSTKISTTNTNDWEQVFDRYCDQAGKDELSFEELSNMFTEMGTRVNRPMLQLLFRLFDSNGDGTVDRQEFLVAITFLAQATATDNNSTDIVGLAYHLFDTNRSGSISQTEFAAMCLVLVNKARFVLAINFLRQAFRECLVRNHCEENLDFYEAVERLVLRPPEAPTPLKSPRPSLLDFHNNKSRIPYSDIKRIFDDYISTTAERQVNVSAKHRTDVEAKLALLNGSEPWVDAHIFDQCVSEIVSLLEADSMPRFKEEIKHTLAARVWEEEKLSPSESMDLDKFRRFADKHPGMFSFLEELRDILLRAQKKQRSLAASKIQKLFRRYKGTVYILGNVVAARKSVTSPKQQQQQEEEQPVN